jgi:hypothetical protein
MVYIVTRAGGDTASRLSKGTLNDMMSRYHIVGDKDSHARSPVYHKQESFSGNGDGCNILLAKLSPT